ncbi:hypothetical protein EAH68_12830 [Corynebacterium hylobatis]|uniref:Uncharacterized protein n=1 Tax=Corynebacterium hylobatis TaxID=1859290 RepID=A0A3S0AUZ3_9CORY|nr:hypothetical protein [Corynebacterium hylobatis]RSZ61541.1 hypothetical protein EAH68_12830 [Corynebacterium hylobatis]
MSTRRLLNLVFQLRQESSFVAKITGSQRISFADERLMDIPEALTGQAHPVRQAIARAEKQRAMEPKRAAALRKAKARRAVSRR